MRILILTFYYRPDLSAGSFRATALVQALRELAPAGTRIDVITSLPNRYQSFAQEAEGLETCPGLAIRRIPLPSHRSDMLGQSRAFLQFARQARKLTADQEYDLVFATSSRLMTAALGASIARRAQAPLYLDIRDIFVDTLTEILPPLISPAVRSAFSRVESCTMRRAQRINLVSPGFEEYFRSRYPDRSYTLFTNGIDDEFIAVAPATVPAVTPDPARGDDARKVVLYAGNIGEGQGLHSILPSLAVALADRARFVVIGDGGRRRMLQEALRGAAAANVEWHAPMSRSALIDAYRNADVLLLHLGRHAAFTKVLPSKLFEYAALGKPVLAGVAGYAARFVREEIRNSAVFAPCDTDGAVRAFGSLELRDTPRPEFIAKFARSGIARAMAGDILALARMGRHS